MERIVMIIGFFKIIPMIMATINPKRPMRKNDPNPVKSRFVINPYALTPENKAADTANVDTMLAELNSKKMYDSEKPNVAAYTINTARATFFDIL
jgi:hypothetical protein